MAEIGFHRYFFWKRDQGICDVRVKSDAEKLLNSKTNQISMYELAYDKYGIEWDGAGNQMDVVPPMPSQSMAVSDVIPSGATSTTTFTESANLPIQKPKMSVMDRMAKARAARKLKSSNGAHA